MRRRGRQPGPDPARPDRVRRNAAAAINTDFIDNSAGVDTSDHEVNIKILLDQVVADGDLTGKQRNELLASMTDEVADLVLADNYDQNIALANAVSHRPGPAARARGLDAHPRARRPAQPRARGAAHPARGQPAATTATGGLTAPELSVLMAYTKIVLGRGAAATATCPTTRSCARSCSPTSRRRCARATAGRWSSTSCAARSWSRRSSTSWSTTPASPTSTGWRGRPTRPRPSSTRANFVAREIFGAAGLQRADRRLRQPARRDGADPHAAGDPDAGRAGVTLAAQQPALTAGHRVGGRHLRGGRREGDGRAARRCWSGASSTPSSSGATRWSRRACRRTSPSGWRCARRRT